MKLRDCLVEQYSQTLPLLDVAVRVSGSLLFCEQCIIVLQINARINRPHFSSSEISARNNILNFSRNVTFHLLINFREDSSDLKCCDLFDRMALIYFVGPIRGFRQSKLIWRYPCLRVAICVKICGGTDKVFGSLPHKKS